MTIMNPQQQHPSSKSKSHSNPISTNLIKRTRHTDQARLKILIDNLHLRLNYAKLKVSHGWHTHTFNQVETLYSTKLHHQHSTSSSSSTSSPSTNTLNQSDVNSNPSPINQHPSTSKPNSNSIQSRPTLLDIALTRTKSDPSTSQPSSSSSQSSSPSNPHEPYTELPLTLNQDLHSFLLPPHQASPNQSFFSTSHQIFGTPLTKSSNPSETPNPFKSITTDRRMSKSLISLFPNILSSEQTNQQNSEIWKFANSNSFSPITFNKNSSQTLKEYELIETQTPITNKFHSIKHSHEYGLTSISPLRFSLNSAKKSGLRKSTGKGASGLNSCNQSLEIEESQGQISLDDLDSINWTSK